MAASTSSPGASSIVAAAARDEAASTPKAQQAAIRACLLMLQGTVFRRHRARGFSARVPLMVGEGCTSSPSHDGHSGAMLRAACP